MKTPLRIRERIQILRDHWYSHIPFNEKFEKLDDKLRLLLDQLVDIRSVKPATGRLRLRQEIGVQILRIVDAVATRNGIPYWLDFGTLLGAVRHQGFIPWDDDIDISMPRDAMNKFISLQKELPDLLAVTTDPLLDIDTDPVLHIYEKRSLCFVDIFPYDLVRGALSSSGRRTEWAKSYSAAFGEANASRKQKRGIQKFRDKWMAEHPSGSGDIDALTVGLEYASAASHYRTIFPVDSVFPLRTIDFEGVKLNAPAEAEVCLRQIYGDYMRFPNDAGTPKHSIFDTSVSTVSTEELRSILDDLSVKVREYIR